MILLFRVILEIYDLVAYSDGAAHDNHVVILVPQGIDGNSTRSNHTPVL